MYEARDFLPGECSMGPEAATFEAIDQAPKSLYDITLKIEIAKAACMSCIQLNHCQVQRREINDVLSSRTRGAQHVIGAEVSKRVTPKEPDPALNEPVFGVDLSSVPHDPRQQWVIIRQGFRRSEELKAKGRELVHHPLLRDRLGAALIAEKPDWTDDEVRAAADAMAAWFLKYRTARLSYRQRKHDLTESELTTFDAISALFVADVEAIKALGLERPAFIARFHEPAFVRSFIQKYESNYNTTPGQVRKVVSHFGDPITKIEETIARNQLSKQSVNASKGSASEVATSSIDELSTAKYKERYQALVREHGLERYFHVPEAKRYFEKIARNSADPNTAVRAFTDHIRQLRRDHPNIEDTVLAYIACVADDAEQSIQDFERHFDAICQKYEKHTYFSRGRFQRMAFMHTEIEEAKAAADAYIDRAVRIEAVCEKAGIEIDDVFIRDTAAYVELDINEDTIIYQHKRYNLRRNLADAECSLEAWMREKIAYLYDHETYMIAARHLSIFLNRGYLQVAFMTEDKPATTHDFIDQKKGRYVVWGDGAAGLTPEEQKAILFVFKLDRIVLGEDVDELGLKRHFQTEDIARYVDEHILPYTLPKPVDLKDGQSMLEWLRYWGRSNKITGSAAKPHRKHHEAALQSTLQKLTKERLDGHSITSEPCKEGLRLLLLRVGLWSLSALKNEETCLAIAHSYLEDVSKIKNCNRADAYTIALGYSAEFCERFQAAVENIVTSRQVADLLNKTTMQATMQLRLYQKRFLEYEPQFASRRIAEGYRRSIAFLYKHDAELIDNLLQTYDEASMKYASHKKVTPGVINHFVLRKRKKNPLAEIQGWLEAVEGLDKCYFTQLDENNIKKVAYTKRGPELATTLDGHIQSIENLLQSTPSHPGIDRSIVEYMIFHTPAPQKGIEAYIARWRFVHTHIDTRDIPLPILRRLILFSFRKPLSGVEGYRKIVKHYEGDPYIKRHMIDEAIKWSITEAMSSLVKMRNLLARGSVKMDRSHNNEKDGRSTHERVSVGVLTPEQIVLGEDSQDQKRQALAAIMQTLSGVEKAVIAAVHGIPWLAPADLRDEEGVNIGFLFVHYGIKRFEALVAIADDIMKKLHQPR